MSTKDHVAVRLDPETLTRVDSIRALLDTEWRNATRSDVLRMLILNGLEPFEKEHKAELAKVRAMGPPPKGGPAKQTTKRKAKRGKATP